MTPRLEPASETTPKVVQEATPQEPVDPRVLAANASVAAQLLNTPKKPSVPSIAGSGAPPRDSKKVLEALAMIAKKGLESKNTDKALMIIQAALGSTASSAAPSEKSSPLQATVQHQHAAPAAQPPALQPQPAPQLSPFGSGSQVPGTPTAAALTPGLPAPGTPMTADMQLALIKRPATSLSHPKEYAAFRRFCERNPKCAEVVRAWESLAQFYFDDIL